MSVGLRPARSTDAGQTGRILQDFIEQTDWMPQLHTGAETIGFCGSMIERGWMTVAHEGRAVRGFLARDAAEIHALYVDRDHTGCGYGRQLLDLAKRQAGRLSLWTFAANTGAQRFYLREGFAETARTDGAGTDENLPNIHYVWRKEAAA